LIVSATLYGATILQTYLYYRNYPKDPRYIKILVFALWIFDTTQLALSTTAMYWYLITNYDNTPALDRLTWSMELQTDCNGILALLVECFFARRVWIMSSNMYLVVIIIVLAVIHFALGIVFTVGSFHLATMSGFKDMIWVTSLGIGSAAAADMVIAGALCFYLSKSRTGFKKTDSLISTLIVYSLSTGLVTSIIGVVIVITYALLPNDYVWLAFFWIDGKCYVNSCLAALNSRESLREKAAPPDSFLQLSQLPNGNIFEVVGAQSARSARSAQSTRSTHEPTNLAITVETDTVFKTDYLDSPTETVKHKLSTISSTSHL